MSQSGQPTVVAFVAPKQVLHDSLDVSLGPCVAKPGRSKALRSPLTQDGQEQPHHTAALHQVLTGQPASAALSLVDQQGPGRLFACSDAFVSALAEKNAELQSLADEDDQRSDDELTTFTAALDALDRAWLEATDWPSHFIGTRNRLAPRLGLGTSARESQTPLWCWYGPSVPQFVVTSGQGRYPGKRM